MHAWLSHIIDSMDRHQGVAAWVQAAGVLTALATAVTPPLLRSLREAKDARSVEIDLVTAGGMYARVLRELVDPLLAPDVGQLRFLKYNYTTLQPYRAELDALTESALLPWQLRYQSRQLTAVVDGARDLIEGHRNRGMIMLDDIREELGLSVARAESLAEDMNSFQRERRGWLFRPS